MSFLELLPSVEEQAAAAAAAHTMAAFVGAPGMLLPSPSPASSTASGAGAGTLAGGPSGTATAATASPASMAEGAGGVLVVALGLATGMVYVLQVPWMDACTDYRYRKMAAVWFPKDASRSSFQKDRSLGCVSEVAPCMATLTVNVVCNSR
jgi:hypothetical protein